MPLRWHWLKLRTTCHPTEDLAKVRQALCNCTDLDSDPFDGATEEIRMESHYGGDVVLLETSLTRARDVRGALGKLPATDKAQLLEELEQRTDEDGIFHFRVSKQDAFGDDVHVTTGDDAIQCRLKPEVHPSSREGALAAIAAWLQGER